MSRFRLSRRDLLRAAATLPLVCSPLWSPHRARAATGVAPLRLLQLFTWYQTPEVYYHPRVSTTSTALAPAGPLAGYDIEYQDSTLKPLAPFKSDLIVFRGLQYNQGPGSHNSHPATFCGATMTAPQTQSQDSATTGTSLDYYLFSRMAKPGSLTPQTFGIGIYDQNNDYPTTAWNNGDRVSQISNPMNLYKALFANFSQGTGSQDAANALPRRLQSLKQVQSSLKNLQARLPSSSSSYTSLQTHLAAAQGLNTQLSPSNSLAGCAPPDASSIPDDNGADTGAGPALSLYDAEFNAYVQMILQGFACDLTRIATLKLTDCWNRIFPRIPNLGYSGTDFHGEVSHGTTGDPNDPLTITMARYKAFFMGQVAQILNALKAVPDPFSPTQSLYDNTVVLIGQEGPIISKSGSDVHANSDSKSDQPYIVAGGCGGYFKGGQLILAGGQTTRTVNHNALLTNVVNAFEKNQQEFNASYTPQILQQWGDFPFSVSPTSWLS